MNRIKIPCHKSNYRSNQIRSLSSIKYIVIHYTANNGDTAIGNGNYFRNNDLRVKNGTPSSAHYFVDETTICQSVEDQYEAYQCGTTGKYFHSSCRNPNSIGIEMVSRKDTSGKYYIKNEVIKNTITLVLELMKKYNIPSTNVVRHYDVTHKLCPEPFVKDERQWINFLEKIEEENMEVKNVNIKTPTGVKSVVCINYKDTNYIKLRDIDKFAPVNISFSNGTITAEPNIETKSIKIDNSKEKIDSINLFDSNYVNLRKFAVALGYSVDYNQNTGEIVLKKGE